MEHTVMVSLTIITATYNGEKTLEAELDSLDSQVSRADEVIIIDGNSSDGTVNILKRRPQSITHWLSEPDSGLYDAWNKALEIATGDWVTFIGCDDVLADEDTIAWWREQLSECPDTVGIVYGQVEMVSVNGTTNGYYGEPWTERGMRDLRSRMLIPFTGAFIRRSLFDKVGRFDPSFRISGDYEWTLRAVKQAEVRSFSRVVALMADNGLSGASESQLAAIQELDRFPDFQGLHRPLIWRWVSLKARVKLFIKKRFGPNAQRIAVDSFRVLNGRKARGTAR